MVLQNIRQDEMTLNMDGAKVKFVAAKTKNALARDGTLKDAERTPKADPRGRSAERKVVVRKDRGVTADGKYAFKQPTESM